MDYIPAFASPIFVGVTVAVFGFLFYAASRGFDGRKNPMILLACTFLALLLVTALLAHRGFFQDFVSKPPRLMIFVIPTFLVMIRLLVYGRSRAVLMKMPVTTLTYIHIVRIPVELCLWWLYRVGLVAQEMTFEGANFDIIAGISAPFAGVFLVGKKNSHRWAAIGWHLICLGLVLNIVIRAVALTPYFYDGSGSELQNLAVFEFPFVWLPTFVVPAVIFSHLTALLVLFKKTE